MSLALVLLSSPTKELKEIEMFYGIGGTVLIVLLVLFVMGRL